MTGAPGCASGEIELTPERILTRLDETLAGNRHRRLGVVAGEKTGQRHTLLGPVPRTGAGLFKGSER